LRHNVRCSRCGCYYKPPVEGWELREERIERQSQHEQWTARRHEKLVWSAVLFGAGAALVSIGFLPSAGCLIFAALVIMCST